jgi:hypothetical protein
VRPVPTAQRFSSSLFMIRNYDPMHKPRRTHELGITRANSLRAHNDRGFNAQAELVQRFGAVGNPADGEAVRG